jgi:hypothetical protein
MNEAAKDRLLPNPKLRLRDQAHEVARFKQFSPRRVWKQLRSSVGRQPTA